jgi:hypothetical protein
VLNDAGRRAAASNGERLLEAGCRVLCVDVFYFGEAKLFDKDWLFALLVSAVGDRPLGIQASQLAAVARWSQKRFGSAVDVIAVGPRTGIIALTAAAIEATAIARLELHDARASLKEIIEANHTVNQMPEMFCFGLLEAFDVRQLVMLVAPRPVLFREPTKRHREDLKALGEWYTLLGKTFDPLR